MNYFFLDVVGNQDLSPLLQSPAIQTVLQMGFDHSLVESLVQTKYLLTGNRYTSVSDLVSDVLQAEEEDRHRSDQARGTNVTEEGYTVMVLLTPCSYEQTP